MIVADRLVHARTAVIVEDGVLDAAGGAVDGAGDPFERVDRCVLRPAGEVGDGRGGDVEAECAAGDVRDVSASSSSLA